MKNQRIFQISDCHLNTADDQAEHSLVFILKQIENHRIADEPNQRSELHRDILLITGDLVCSPTVELYATFKRIVETQCSIQRIFAIAGNHDQSELMNLAFSGSRIQTKRHLNLGKQCQLIFADSSEKPISKMALGAGRVTQKELERIKKSTRQKNSLVIIHHPIIKLGAKWFQQIGIENHLKVEKAIHQQSIAVISGHAHGYFNQKLSAKLTDADLTTNSSLKTHISQVVSPATCYGFDHQIDDYQRTSTIGYMSYQLHDLDNKPKLSHSLHQFQVSEVS